MLSLTFHAGTVELRGAAEGSVDVPPSVLWDVRTACYRAPAVYYASLVLALRAQGVQFEDKARNYETLERPLRVHREPRPYQTEALAAWNAQQGRGVVVLPTGAGKSQLAVMAIADRARATLVVAPTLDLVHQWYELLRLSFADDVGVIGGGEHVLRDLTVTTYDSAYLHMEHLGARFGLVVFDECHHLPGESYALAARQCLAPFRLGLTATPERADGRDSLMTELVGPIAYRKDITDLSGGYLADYDVETVEVSLTEAEREEYEAERSIYTGFLRSQGIRMSGPRGWSDFVMRASRGEAGRRAMSAYRRQKALALAAPAKLEVLEHLFSVHRGDLTLVFTQDNRTAYEIAQRFLIPVITHQTKVTERSEILQRFSAGQYSAVVTSKVLNEGVDVPEASVAVILSGSGSVREHVQRLGRILRPRQGKRAILYEVLARDTSETFTSKRRREHDAYR